MASWDEYLKKLVCSAPQEFASWTVGDAIFDKIESGDLHMQSHNRRADLLLRMLMNDLPMILALEIQSTRDPRMAERLMEYNILVENHFHIPVLSCVINLCHVNNRERPPKRSVLPNGREIYRFDYEEIDLVRLPTEQILQAGLPALLALIPFTREGQQRSNLEQMVERLRHYRRYDVLSLAMTIASGVIKDVSERRWLERMFDMVQNDLSDSWVYQRILQEGHVEAAGQALILFVQGRFPELIELAREQVSKMTFDEQAFEALQQVIVQISIARSSDEVHAHLLALTTKR